VSAVAETGLQTPEPVGVPLARANLALEMWRLLVDEVTASITGEFAARRIPCILIKGPVLARLLYDVPDERPYTDTDLLIQESDLTRAEQALRDCGFVRADRDEDWLGPEPKYAHTFERPADRGVIDLHWRLSGAGAAAAQVWSTLAPRTETLEVAGRVVATLDPPACAALVALHNAHHGDARPRTLTDLDHAAARLDISVWRDAASIAHRLRAAESFAAGMRLTHAGGVVADLLGLDEPASIEMWLKTHPSSYGAWVMSCLSRTPTFRGRLQLVARVIAPPRVVMFTFFPLSRRGRVGLVLAYILRPLRLLAKGGPAIRDWSRARRALRAHARRGSQTPSDTLPLVGRR
jgi:hypothetical protein